MQVYLPDDLYAVVKERQLPASELLQDAVRAELRRLALQAESERDTDILEITRTWYFTQGDQVSAK